MTHQEPVNLHDGQDPVSPRHEKKQSYLVWRNVIILAIAHIGAAYGLYAFLFKAKWLTFIFAYVVNFCASLGISAGAHRLWSHKSYKARLPLQLLLVFFNTVAIQGPAINWARDHRLHHKYSDTDADPYNSERGLFFSHIGWLLVRKHPEVKAKWNTIDSSDLINDPLLRFQKRHYAILSIIAIAIPLYIPTLWGETLWNGLAVCTFYRWIISIHVTGLINSMGHAWGNRPYDKNIKPSESKILSYLTYGDGHHNYHHTFPWDYKSANLHGFFNFTRVFIDIMAKIGWAYDLKTASPDLIRRRVENTGDGSRGDWG